jgi:hypothetical protein
MNRRILILIGLVIFGSIILALYTFLGGFNDIAISSQPVSSPRVLVGLPYDGPVRSVHLDSIYQSVRQLYEQGKLKGELGALYADVPKEKRRKGEIAGLIGVWVKDSLQALPPGFTRRVVNTSQVVQANIQAHFLVSPSPDEVQEDMREYARAQQLKPESYVMEKYLSDNSIILEIPVISNQ